MRSVVVVDYGMSNLRSVHRALAAAAPADLRVLVSGDAADIARAERVVFPGQGAAQGCLAALQAGALADALARAAAEKPFLGICMGMQVLFERSGEGGGVECLGLLRGEVRHLSDFGAPGAAHRIPHMGWNQVRQRPHPLWDGIADDSCFYFAHSYYARPATPAIVAGEVEYGRVFACSVAAGFVFAVQFHPEKSAADGLRLLRNFLHWDGDDKPC